MIERQCEACGAPFLAHPSQVRRGPNRARFCSHACKARRGTLAERFWSKVDKNGPIVVPELGPCWVWTGCLQSQGYGQLAVDGKARYAHHVAWFLEHGVWSARFVLHRCDNRPCVRHLFEGDHAANMADMLAKGRNSRGVPHGDRTRGDLNGSRLHPERVPRGARHPAAKLAEADVIAIRQRRARGESLTSLSEKFGIGETAVSAIARRLTWKHVE
jgi:hypothetical protein